MISLYVFRGFRGGTQRMYLSANVEKSTMSTHTNTSSTASSRFGLSSACQLNESHDSGVSCDSTRFALPIGVLYCDTFIQRYSLTLSHDMSICPRMIPQRLHTITSKIMWSHQHSAKLGIQCSNDISTNSNTMLLIHAAPAWRKMSDFPIHPRKWATMYSSNIASCRFAKQGSCPFPRSANHLHPSPPVQISQWLAYGRSDNDLGWPMPWPMTAAGEQVWMPL
mmetsp:Transcript_28007/g.66830  ORF Transcript_28007/g.66830 Transcript_28007/m.66830 type:complete len:223 (+) Transcript_28007:336-1004(+)